MEFTVWNGLYWFVTPIRPQIILEYMIHFCHQCLKFIALEILQIFTMNKIYHLCEIKTWNLDKWMEIGAVHGETP